MLRKAAAERGDPSIRRIVATTGLPRSVVYRNLGGHNEPSLSTLMRFWEVYGVSVEHLIHEVDEETAASG